MFNVSLGFLALQATTGRAAAWLRQELLMLPTKRFLDLVLFVNKYYLYQKEPN